MCYIKPDEAPTASGIEKYEKLFGGDRTAKEVEALDALLPAAQPRRRKATSWVVPWRQLRLFLYV
jgi:hypothetical protein